MSEAAVQGGVAGYLEAISKEGELEAPAGHVWIKLAGETENYLLPIAQTMGLSLGVWIRSKLRTTRSGPLLVDLESFPDQPHLETVPQPEKKSVSPTSKPQTNTGQPDRQLLSSSPSTKLRVSEGRVEFLVLNQITESAWNPNEMDDEKFAALIQDMREGGFYTINPIQVFPIAPTESGGHRYQIADGHHRFRAAKKVPWGKIRAEILFETTEAEAKVINYKKNHERGNLNPIKEAELFFDEWEKGKGTLTQDQIARKYLVSQAHVSERLGLLDMPAAVKKAVKTGELPSTHAETIYHGVINPQAQEIVGQIAAKKKLSPVQTTALVQAVGKQLRETPNIRPKALREETVQIAKQIKAVKPSLKATNAQEFAELVRNAPSETIAKFATGNCPWCGKSVRWMGGHTFAKGK